MVIMGFLAKGGERFSLTTDSAMFLDKQSPAYAGFATRFLTSPLVTENFRDLATVVRTGKPLSGEALTKAEHPAWVDFAQVHGTSAAYGGSRNRKTCAQRCPHEGSRRCRGHGMFGITIAQPHIGYSQ
jgi:hypothetical protein